MKFNIFYIAIVLIGIALYFAFQPMKKSELSFYGFAENKETEINYNYPVVVQNIFVQEGQAVKRGDSLVYLRRQEKKEDLLDQNFEIATLKAEEQIWKEKKKNELDLLETKKEQVEKEFELKISLANAEMQKRQILLQNLQSIKFDSTALDPYKEDILGFEQERDAEIKELEKQMNGIISELSLGIYPYQTRIEQLSAEKKFKESTDTMDILVLAPYDGLVGNIYCKEAEHIDAFKTLLSYYEPYPSMIKGYVNENLILEVKEGDLFSVSSLKNEELKYEAEVIGLGSRIVEIPSRMRKRPEIKTYGREVLLGISNNCDFLQGEKVSIQIKSAKK